MGDALKYAEGLEAHLDEGGTFSYLNVRDLIRMVKETEAMNAELVGVLNSGTINQLLGMIEDTGRSDAWSLARSWMEQRDATLSRARSETPEGET